MAKPEYLVSACLAGINCRYDGGSAPVKRIVSLVESGDAIPFCPEQLGGLPTPRITCEIVTENGERKVRGKDGSDYTAQFIHGAELSLELAKENRIIKAVLKSGSPSCGFGEIYDGTFSGSKSSGNGFTADIFQKNGITVITEKDFIP